MDYIAEIGSNFCGSLPLALAHITAAEKAGATGVKFQLFRGETLDSRPEMQERLKPYELPLDWLPKLCDVAHLYGLSFGITPFAVDLAEECSGGVDWIKISAYDLTFDDLVSAAAALNVPVVLSTAMATEQEIAHAVALLPDSPAPVLLHGVAQYPARLEDQNLGWLGKMAYMHQGFARFGLSDHTHGREAAMLAVALGATWIEKHFKIGDHDAQGILGKSPRFADSPDYEVSADPWEFASMVGACERARQALGTGEKNGPLDVELPLYTTLRRTNDKRVRG